MLDDSGTQIFKTEAGAYQSRYDEWRLLRGISTPLVLGNLVEFRSTGTSKLLEYLVKKGTLKTSKLETIQIWCSQEDYDALLLPAPPRLKCLHNCNPQTFVWLDDIRGGLEELKAGYMTFENEVLQARTAEHVPEVVAFATGGSSFATPIFEIVPSDPDEVQRKDCDYYSRKIAPVEFRKKFKHLGKLLRKQEDYLYDWDGNLYF
ncbi:hypothetical protein ABW19_dt0207975 [Dactylella cylindrospora]|nr:hypothetical protein ABW19_dt0207975 [Dactylella cylindrospora]